MFVKATLRNLKFLKVAFTNYLEADRVPVLLPAADAVRLRQQKAVIGVPARQFHALETVLVHQPRRAARVGERVRHELPLLEGVGREAGLCRDQRARDVRTAVHSEAFAVALADQLNGAVAL